MVAQFTKDLKAKNLKVTPQRMAMLHEIEENGHMDVDELYARIKEFYPSISLATIYKNIDALCEANILREIKAPNHKQKYELACDKHIHVACEKCGKFEDLKMDTTTLEERGSQKSGYRLYDTSAVLIGVCPECVQRA